MPPATNLSQLHKAVARIRMNQEDPVVTRLQMANDALTNELTNVYKQLEELRNQLFEEKSRIRTKADSESIHLKMKIRKIRDSQTETEKQYDEKLRKERLARLDAENRLAQLLKKTALNRRQNQ